MNVNVRMSLENINDVIGYLILTLIIKSVLVLSMDQLEEI